MPYLIKMERALVHSEKLLALTLSAHKEILSVARAQFFKRLALALVKQ